MAASLTRVQCQREIKSPWAPGLLPMVTFCPLGARMAPSGFLA